MSVIKISTVTDQLPPVIKIQNKIYKVKVK
jgi:hypothetical protein